MKFMVIRKDLVIYVKPHEKLVFTERTGFLQMSQREEGTEADYIDMLREVVHYCKLIDLKTSPHHEAEMI